MKLLSSNRNKIILIIFISVLTFAAWMSGMEKVYTRVLLGTTNVGLTIFSKDTNIELEETPGRKVPYQFKVHTVIDGRKGSYPQEIGGILQPFVIILSWQIFLFFLLNYKDAFKSSLINIGIFLLIQSLYLVLLTNYYSSDTAKYLYSMLLDGFYIIALVFIIKDNMIHKIFRKKQVGRT